jgi:RNA polymerase sigma-70 factor (ECF subfamily)
MLMGRHFDAATLFRRHAPFVASFVHKLGAQPHEIEDLVQEVFLVAHRRGGFADDGRARPTTWLAEISLRVWSSTRRRRLRKPEDPDQATVSHARAPGQSPLRAVENGEALDRVRSALEDLDEDRRAIFILFELEGEPCTAIAAALDIPVGTVYSRLHKARKEFREAYQRLTAPTSSTRPPTCPHSTSAAEARAVS